MCFSSDPALPSFLSCFADGFTIANPRERSRRASSWGCCHGAFTESSSSPPCTPALIQSMSGTQLPATFSFSALILEKLKGLNIYLPNFLIVSRTTSSLCGPQRQALLRGHHTSHYDDHHSAAAHMATPDGSSDLPRTAQFPEPRAQRALLNHVQSVCFSLPCLPPFGAQAGESI